VIAVTRFPNAAVDLSYAIQAPSPPDYSVVIPAYNEENFLPATLDALAIAMAGLKASGEIIVVDNNSTDATAAVAEAYGVRLVCESINQISRARNTGAANATGKYLIFVDADTLVTPALLGNAIAALDSGKVCGGGARVSVNHQSRLANVAVVVWNTIARAGKLAAGCFIYSRRDAFSDVGGFSDKVYASEEIWLSRALKRWGGSRQQKFLILDDAALTSARKADWMSATAIAKQFLVLLIFPFAVRSKRFCGSWYKRPGG
jgi:glycosyltransferase involved in cell wall biosynthesis